MIHEINPAAHSLLHDRVEVAVANNPRLALEPYYQIKQAALIVATELLECIQALNIAERFMSGFEDDEMQIGINDKLATIRAAMNKRAVL